MRSRGLAIDADVSIDSPGKSRIYTAGKSPLKLCTCSTVALFLSVEPPSQSTTSFPAPRTLRDTERPVSIYVLPDTLAARFLGTVGKEPTNRFPREKGCTGRLLSQRDERSFPLDTTWGPDFDALPIPPHLSIVHPSDDSTSYLSDPLYIRIMERILIVSNHSKNAPLRPPFDAKSIGDQIAAREEREILLTIPEVRAMYSDMSQEDLDRLEGNVTAASKEIATTIGSAVEQLVTYNSDYGLKVRSGDHSFQNYIRINNSDLSVSFVGSVGSDKEVILPTGTSYRTASLALLGPEARGSDSINSAG
ncbi:hypothetical protein P7C73_g5061, partial [Tremellales sp. Uapishka_1]